MIHYESILLRREFIIMMTIIIIIIIIMSRDNVVDIVTKLQAERPGVRVPAGSRLSSPETPDRLWGPPSLLFSEKRCYFSGLKRLECVVDHSLSSNAELKNE
jgi:hypothetical protein